MKFNLVIYAEINSKHADSASSDIRSGLKHRCLKMLATEFRIVINFTECHKGLLAQGPKRDGQKGQICSSPGLVKNPSSCR